jgi:uncharacterized protein (DUF2267 family)
MDYEEFISAAQDLLELDRDRAERAVEATLKTLADRLSTEQALHLVELLPPELGPALFHFGAPERLDVDAFLQRVADREDVDLKTARRHAELVLAVFARAVGSDEFDRLAATFPKDFTPLLPRGPAIDPPSRWNFDRFSTAVSRGFAGGAVSAVAGLDCVMVPAADLLHIEPGTGASAITAPTSPVSVLVRRVPGLTALLGQVHQMPGVTGLSSASPSCPVVGDVPIGERLLLRSGQPELGEYWPITIGPYGARSSDAVAGDDPLARTVSMQCRSIEAGLPRKRFVDRGGRSRAAHAPWSARRLRWCRAG